MTSTTWAPTAPGRKPCCPMRTWHENNVRFTPGPLLASSQYSSSCSNCPGLGAELIFPASPAQWTPFLEPAFPSASLTQEAAQPPDRFSDPPYLPRTVHRSLAGVVSIPSAVPPADQPCWPGAPECSRPPARLG